VEPFATAALLVIGLVAYSNYAHGTLGTWFKSKFFNATDPQNVAKVVGSVAPKDATHQNLTRPVPGAITHPFGEQRAGHTHQGVDMQASQGDPIVAANAGTVSALVANSGACGNRIDIDQGTGLVTRYCHLSAFSVKQGDTVSAGQTIGKVGGTPGTDGAGDATGPHLHFEVLINGVAVDPAPLIGG
jgi:murein DD-endopeptidase MepM/ murein hydrolase activator NlpD